MLEVQALYVNTIRRCWGILILRICVIQEVKGQQQQKNIEIWYSKKIKNTQVKFFAVPWFNNNNSILPLSCYVRRENVRCKGKKLRRKKKLRILKDDQALPVSRNDECAKCDRECTLNSSI